MHSSRRYWYIQLTGWFIYGAVGLLISRIFATISIQVVAMQISAVIVMLLSTHLLRFVIKNKGWMDHSIASSIGRILLSNVFLALVANALVTAFGMALKVVPIETYSGSIFMVYWFQTFVFLLLWSALYISIKYFRNYKQGEIEKWKLEAAVKDAELIALKAQINPHFLFNALNNIRGLILEDQMKARGMVDNLSELLRYSIQFNNQEKVTVKEELDVVEKYLALEAVHYEERLKYELDIPGNLLGAKVPPMIIQLMIENAIKHGISLQKSGGTILVKLTEGDGHLVIQISNTGSLTSTDKQGIGIKNAMERVHLLFYEMPTFDLTEENGTVVATLKLPLER